MEKGLGQLCLWGGGSAVRGPSPFPTGRPHLHPAPYLQSLRGAWRPGSQDGGGGRGDFPHEAPTPPTAARYP